MSRKIRDIVKDLFILNDATHCHMESSHTPTHTPINLNSIIESNPDLAKAVEVLRRDKKLSKVSLELEFGWTEWRARKVYEKIRWLCNHGLSFKIDDKYLVCEVHQGYVELTPLDMGREYDDVELRPDLNERLVGQKRP